MPPLLPVPLARSTDALLSAEWRISVNRSGELVLWFSCAKDTLLFDSIPRFKDLNWSANALVWCLWWCGCIMGSADWFSILIAFNFYAWLRYYGLKFSIGKDEWAYKGVLICSFNSPNSFIRLCPGITYSGESGFRCRFLILRLSNV